MTKLGSILPIKKERPDTLHGVTHRAESGCGHVYVTINYAEDGLPFEIFVSVGKMGSCEKCVMQAVSRLITLAIRCSVPMFEIVKQLRGLQCPKPVPADGGGWYRSCPDAIAAVLADHALGGKTLEEAEEAFDTMLREHGMSLEEAEEVFEVMVHEHDKALTDAEEAFDATLREQCGGII